MTDIITLRPEVQLCYVGIANKCFEILENRPTDMFSNCQNGNNNSSNPVHGDASMSHAPVVVEDATDEDDTEDDDHDDEDSQNEGTPTSPTEPEDGQSENSYDESDGDSFVEPMPQPRLRLREILFYDDKVGIFKARHARL